MRRTHAAFPCQGLAELKIKNLDGFVPQSDGGSQWPAWDGSVRRTKEEKKKGEGASSQWMDAVMTE